MARSRSRSFGGPSSSSGLAGRLLGVLVVLGIVVLVGGAFLLDNWVSAPATTTVEKVIPNDRFQR